MLGKVYVLDPQADAFHQTQATAVQEFGHQLVFARPAADDTLDLVFGQHGG